MCSSGGSAIFSECLLDVALEDGACGSFELYMINRYWSCQMTTTPAQVSVQHELFKIYPFEGPARQPFSNHRLSGDREKRKKLIDRHLSGQSDELLLPGFAARRAFAKHEFVRKFLLSPVHVRKVLTLLIVQHCHDQVVPGRSIGCAPSEFPSSLFFYPDTRVVVSQRQDQDGLQHDVRDGALQQATDVPICSNVEIIWTEPTKLSIVLSHRESLQERRKLPNLRWRDALTFAQKFQLRDDLACRRQSLLWSLIDACNISHIAIVFTSLRSGVHSAFHVNTGQ